MGRVTEQIIGKASKEGRRYLMEPESKSILEELNIATTGGTLAFSEAQAVEMFEALEGPAVMKVVSPRVVHKSDAGGVKLNIRNRQEAKAAYNEIIGAFTEENVEAVSVQSMARPGIEAIVGITRDPTFGPLLMFGLGGVFVEVLKDVSFRSIPVSPADVASMIEEIKGYRLLKGVRGYAADLPALQQLLLRVSELVLTYPEISEVDLNPVFLYADGYVVADARMFVDGAVPSIAPRQESGGLRTFFYPRSIAVLGASNSEGKLGWNVFHNLISHGFPGRLYPINFQADEVQGVKAYGSITDVTEPVDVAIVLVPAAATPKAVEECCARGIRSIVVESAGFAELGPDGKKAEEEMERSARRYGCRLLGPNCSGIINTHSNMVQSIGAVGELGKGTIGLIAQAGVYAAGMLWGLRRIIDFGIVATIGNKLDVNETDVLEVLGNDPHISVICMYIEDVKSGRRFVDVARQVTRTKPVIVVKSGRTDAGKKAVSSHTASLAGNDEVYSAIFRQCDIIRARDNEQMFALARGFSKQPLPDRAGVLIISYAGSLGVMATDAVHLNGMRLAELEPHLKQRLRSILPGMTSGLNPVDYTFTMSADDVRKTIEIGAESADVGGFIVILQTEILKEYLTPLREINYKGKPILACVACKEFVTEDVIGMEKAGIPVYETPETAAEVLSAMYRHSLRIKGP